MNRSIKRFAGLLFFVILFVLIRVLYMNTTLWYDEACSWYTAIQTFPVGIIKNLMNLDLQHSPLYFFLLNFWIKLFGQGELALRLLSFIFGVLTVPLVYIVSRKISNKTVACFSSAVVAFNPLLCLFSVEVRMYPMVIFLVLLSFNYLIDFENEGDKKSLLNLIITNILIPYTYVGGIFYNISLLICYGIYLYKNKTETFKKYVSYELIEYVALIPYFVLIMFYAAKRHVFVISHEGHMEFVYIADAIRNFFGANIVPNVYWPSAEPYKFTFIFTLLVVIPCIYFLYGLFKGFAIKDKFINSLYKVFILCFILFVIFAYLKVSVFTVRYLLYLLPPLFILSVLGLFYSLKNNHCKTFLLLYILCSICFSFYNIPRFKVLKGLAFKSVRVEATKLGLTNEDMVIMPFGADAPYYFRDFDAPIVLDFDFHKQVRNPENNLFYDDSMMNVMKTKKKYALVKNRINDNSIFSKNFELYFANNVNMNVASGRFVEVMFRKFLCDVIEMLSIDFELVKFYQKDNYTYYLFQKR